MSFLCEKKMRDLEKSVQLRQDLRMFYSERCLVEVLGPLQHTQETVRRLKGKVANGESRGQSCRRRGWGNVDLTSLSLAIFGSLSTRL